MKIAFIGEAISGFGGMETVIRQVIHHLSKAPFNYQCKAFFFCRKDIMHKGWLDGINTHYSFSANKFSALRKAKHIHAIRIWLQQEKPDIVIAIDPLSCLLSNKARKQANQHFTLFSWPHFSLDHKKHAGCITWADRHLAISQGIHQQMLKKGIADERIHVIYNPTESTSVVIPSPAAGETATFLYVGRIKFEGQKRIKDLLDGFSRVPGRWALHIIGDGSDRERCQAYSRELCLDKRISWHGWQAEPWKVVQDKIGAVSALVLTSSFEGFPMTLLEAMARGIPCISADCLSGPRDIIRPGVNGYLYTPGDTGELSAIVSGIISGEDTFDPASVQGSIATFYSDPYYRRLNSILLSSLHSEAPLLP